jgi:lactate racemase
MNSTQPDQWAAHIQALVQSRAQVLLYSGLPPEVVRAAYLDPCNDVETTLTNFLVGRPASTVAVLPQGPLTIPYLDQQASEVN